MASQRVTLAKVGGEAADAIWALAQRWLAARTTDSPNEWSSEQWPSAIRTEADNFADRLRLHGCEPPVVSFCEWSDLWSMGDIFNRSLCPPESPQPTWVYGNKYEIRGYMLPDGGRLQEHLAGLAPYQADEYQLLANRLIEAIDAWNQMVERAALILIRETVGGLVSDEELIESLKSVPPWLTRNA